jgi:hypothetical protein
MSQLIENKRNHPVLIANFEPNEIATKSEEKTKNQRRKHRAGEAAQKIEVQTRKHRAGEVACHGGQAQKVGMQPRIHCGVNQNEDLIMAPWTNEPFPASRRAVLKLLCELTQGVRICRGYSRVGRNFSFVVAPKW